MAEWQERPAQVVVTPGPYVAPPVYYFAPFAPAYAVTRFPAAYLRLIFAPDGRLAQFKEFAR